MSADDDPRVVIVDDHALFRAGVRSELEGRVEIVGEAGDGRGGRRADRAAKPDVVLLDVHMPDGGGVAVCEALREGHVRFLALSVSDAPEDVIAVIRAGARGYVTKTIDAERLADAIERVADGDAVFSPKLAGFVLDAFRGQAAPAADGDLDQLTPREQEVLRLIARGYLYKEVAFNLGISAKTVEAHVDGGAAQAPVHQPPRAQPLGDGAGPGLRGQSPQSDLSAGNSTTSRIECFPVSTIVRRSMPRPRPPVGGMPCSSAWTNTSS